MQVEAALGNKNSLCQILFLLPMVSWLTVGLSTRPAEAAPPREAGIATAVEGPVTVTHPFTPTRLLKVDQGLNWRDVIETPKNATAQLILDQKTTVTIRELSRLELRKERLPTGVRYVVELLSGKVRMSVDRALMRPGDQVQVRSRNAVASVRGTEFIVETAGDSTTVYTLSGVVEVANRRGAPVPMERIGAYEVARVSGRKAPVVTPLRPAPTSFAVAAEPASSGWKPSAPLLAALLSFAALISFFLTARAYSFQATYHGTAPRRFSSR